MQNADVILVGCGQAATPLATRFAAVVPENVVRGWNRDYVTHTCVTSAISPGGALILADARHTLATALRMRVLPDGVDDGALPYAARREYR